MTDPFAIKAYPRYHPRRLVFTAIARWQDRRARRHYNHYGLPTRTLAELPPVPTIDWSQTAVKPLELQHLLATVTVCKRLNPAPVLVEIGSYRGASSRCLAQVAAPGRLFCVDPYGGYGGSEQDLALFRRNTVGVGNLTLLRQTSGQAAKSWSHGPVDLVFIDAVHDYVNTRFDLAAWSSKLRPGGFLAAHDTDAPDMPGTRRAVWEFVQQGAELFAHVENITIMRLR